MTTIKPFIQIIFIFVKIIIDTAIATAASYDCKVLKKLNYDITYSKKQMDKLKFTIKIIDRDELKTLSRCSYSPINKKITCDTYQVDKVVFDEKVLIKKFYVFNSQFDIQLFSDLTFLENNGRGDISYGKCEIISP